MGVEVFLRRADDTGVFPGISSCLARAHRRLPILAGMVIAFCSCSPSSEHASSAAIAVASAKQARPGAIARAPRLSEASAVPSAHERSDAPEIVRLEIGGMVCQGCVARVQASLAAVPGVHRVDVSLADQRAVVLADPAVRDTALTGAVRRAGSEFLGIVIK
jgi:copper chaperone CopZ